MRKAAIILIILSISTSGLLAQIVIVKDRETSLPLEMVTLNSRDPFHFALTNAQGKADISDFGEPAAIEIRMLGYTTQTLSFKELTNAGYTVLLAPSSISIDNIVISASRRQQLADDIPVRIKSVSQLEVQFNNPQTAADLLNVSGEVYIQKSQQGGGSPMIRGFSTNRLLYAVDGVRMNTAIFRSGNLQNVISLDPFAMESTEVLFGPGSVIYGSDAIGGVMSFQTLTPQLSLNDSSTLSGNLATRYSSANREKTLHFDFNLGCKKWAFTTSVSSHNFGDMRMGENGPDEYLRPFYVKRVDNADVVVENEDQRVQTPSAYSQINLMQKIRFVPSEKWDLEYGFHYSETSDYDRYDRHLRTRNNLPRYGEWYYGPQIWMMNLLTVRLDQSTGAFDELVVHAAHQHFEESRISRDLNDAERQNRLEKVSAYSLNIDFTKALGAERKLFYGIENVYDMVNSTGTNEDILTGISTAGPSRYPASSWSSHALYASLHYPLSEKWTLQAGTRYNYYRLQADFDTTFYPFPFTTADIGRGALTGSLGAVFHASRKTVVSLNLATGFRAPNVDDMGKVFDSEPGSVVVPNPELEAEYAYNAEIDVVHVFGKVLKVDFAAYYTLLENAMVRRDFVLNGLETILYDGTPSQVQAIQNAASAKVYGLQAGVEYEINRNLSFSSQINWQDGQEEMDDGSESPTRHVAPLFGKSELQYKKGAWKLGLTAIYNGARTHENMPLSELDKTYMYAENANGQPWSPGWYILNINALWHISPFLSASAGIENLSNQRYRPYSSGITGPGRNLVLSVRAAF